MIQKIEKEFIGLGEVKGVHFKQIAESDKGYIYARKDGNVISYEVFLKQTVAKCIDFEKRIYSESERKEVYPKSKDFGVWAWSYHDINKAGDKLSSF